MTRGSHLSQCHTISWHFPPPSQKEGVATTSFVRSTRPPHHCTTLYRLVCTCRTYSPKAYTAAPAPHTIVDITAATTPRGLSATPLLLSICDNNGNHHDKEDCDDSDVTATAVIVIESTQAIIRDYNSNNRLK
ncbi:hypothetical protein EDB85DRAFT_1890165 [Lactarius pseudohatsudake]|nr:hypothetical protein EDB85DRAFT_1890165 [Lactarius pseudohatsudake]